MRIAIFNFNDELSGEGSRVISAVLKQAGHDVIMIFMPYYGAEPLTYIDPALREKLANRDIFMMSLYSCYEHRAREVTRYLKETYKKPVLWGGVHVTALPHESLKYADIACRGEGEEAILEFCRRWEAGEGVSSSPNIVVKRPDGQGTIENPLLPLETELGKYPHPDYELETHWVLDGGRVVPCTPELLEKYHTVYYHDRPSYFVMTTRGCPYVCTYCYQSQLVNTYDDRRLRYKNVERTIEEIKLYTTRFPFLKSVGFSDDDFFARKVDDLREMMRLYKEQINLPFGCSAIPASVTEEKLRLLVEAGLVTVQIGIQSGSDRVNREIYRRFLAKTKVLNCLELMEPYHKSHGLRVSCDWIIDNPWETEEDVLQSIEFSLQIPRWVVFNIFTLTYYPGTTLYNKAIQDGIISKDDNAYHQVFNVLNRVKHSYLTHVFLLKHRARRFAPNRLVRILTSKPARFVGERSPDWLLQGMWGNWLFPKLAAASQGEGVTGSGSVY
ncbi:MAG: radical SAM protein [Planctomycetota bacterium]